MLKSAGNAFYPRRFLFFIKQTTDILAFIILLKRQFKSSCIWGRKKKYVVAKDINISINTYSKYLKKCFELGLCRFDINNDIIFSSYINVFEVLFGEAGQGIHINKEGSFQQVKENVREQLLIANFRQQEFIILGDRQLERGDKKRNLRASLAHAWIKNKSPFRASNVNNIITSTRHAGKIIGLSATTAIKTLNSILRKGLVQYEYEQSRFSIKGNHQMRCAFAEQNRPYPNCGYSILKEGILYHLGRIVRIQ